MKNKKVSKQKPVIIRILLRKRETLEAFPIPFFSIYDNVKLKLDRYYGNGMKGIGKKYEIIIETASKETKLSEEQIKVSENIIVPARLGHGYILPW